MPFVSCLLSRATGIRNVLHSERARECTASARAAAPQVQVLKSLAPVWAVLLSALLGLQVTLRKALAVGVRGDPDGDHPRGKNESLQRGRDAAEQERAQHPDQ